MSGAKLDARAIAAAIRKAVGAKPGDIIEIVTPQFTRPASDPAPGLLAPTLADFEALRTLPPRLLREAGMRPWGEEPEGQPGARMLWLFPGEWYPHIPAGLEIVSISGKRERFVPGRTDNDIRFGCLAYGFLEADGSAPTHTGGES